jgi:hypothetical protein
VQVGVKADVTSAQLSKNAAFGSGELRVHSRGGVGGGGRVVESESSRPR